MTMIRMDAFYDPAGTLWRPAPMMTMPREQVASFGGWVCPRHGPICDPERLPTGNACCPRCTGHAERLVWQPPLAARVRSITVNRPGLRWSRVYA